MLESEARRYPLTAAQMGIWIGQALAPESPAYNVGEYLVLDGPLDRGAFELALRQTLEEAEALRARFVVTGAGPVQEIHALGDWTLGFVDVSSDPHPESRAEVTMRGELSRALDLGAEAPSGHTLFRLGPERHLWFQRAHHVVLDGFGFTLVARRVAELYTSIVAGSPAPARWFGALRAVVEEDGEYQSSATCRRDRDAWLERYADAPEVVSLSSRSGRATARRLRLASLLSEGTLERWATRTQDFGASWADLVLAATAAYVFRTTGARDVVLGQPVLARLGTAALRVPCMAMNIVPLRVAMDRGDGAEAWIRRVAAERRRMRPHERYRYEHLRRDRNLVGGGRRLFGPVVNVMPFTEPLSFGGARATVRNVSAGPVEDVSITVRASAPGEGPCIELDANPEAYDLEELERHRDGLFATLNEMVEADVPRRTRTAAPRAPATGAAASAPAPRARSFEPSLLVGEPLAPRFRTLVDALVAAAEAHPDDVALVHEGGALRYQELVARARSVAARLKRHGAGPGVLVAVTLPRRFDAVMGILGALFAGAAYLALDPHAPPARTGAILSSARPALWLTPRTTAAETPVPPETRVLLVAGLDELVEHGEGDGITELGASPERSVSPSSDDLAYVVYTSGSTGAPKGVMIEHRAVVAFVEGALARYGLRRGDRVLQFGPLHFDASVEEIFVTLAAGATLVLRSDGMMESIPRLLDACAEQAVTVLDVPTAYWHELAYAVSQRGLRLPPTLRVVILGGEAVLPERVARWRAAVGDAVTLVNTYGPSEATVVATTAVLAGEGAADWDGVTAPIGRPLPGIGAVVVDATGHIVPRGDVGELCLFGPTLARGYLGAPPAAHGRFAPLDALPERPRAYHTGDRARLRDDGLLVFEGRVDDQLKVGGHRVEPAEIESALLAIPGVREAAVVGRPRPQGGVVLAAYVARDDDGPDVPELRRHLRATLPPMLVPSVLETIPALPRTTTGKIDRAALRNAVVAADVERATTAESRILRIWADVLGARHLSPDDDFFEHGGQSLQTLQVANRLSSELGVDVPVGTLFRHSTARALAHALSDLEAPGRDLSSTGLSLEPILELNAGTKQPLFCIHPAGGLGWCYRVLTRALPPSHGVYALQARGLEGAPAAMSSLDELAAEYAARIRAVEPRGPYALLGWSMGGVLAHAAAAKLAADGERVPLLVLLDAYPSDAWARIETPDDDVVLAALRQAIGPGDALRPGSAREGRLRAALFEVARRFVHLARTAKHPRFEGDLVFVEATRDKPSPTLSPAAWRPWVSGNIETVQVDVSHADLLTPGALATLGPLLRRKMGP